MRVAQYLKMSIGDWRINPNLMKNLYQFSEDNISISLIPYITTFEKIAKWKQIEQYIEILLKLIY
ncbi:unnamed protein product [Paramecium octaurelia]|uniref:Uncharacterized protein n=1 Tax=Paramecium octaurelia TaxID=43137 RepID=A0A8S1TV91_PAROT|nr:unnamed protein product [Paramecium octaurelia]